MAESSQGPETSLVCIQYNLESVATIGVFKNCFVLSIHTYEKDGDEFIVVHLTVRGNEVLCEVCHTADQKDVWCFPSYEFVVCKDSLSVIQVSDNFSHTKARLIELIDSDCSPFLC